MDSQQVQGKYPQQGYPHYGYPPSQDPRLVVLVQQPAQSSAAYRSGRRREERGSDDYEVFGSSFDNKEIRANFIRKVYTILSLQLLFTAGVCAMFMFVVQLKRFVMEVPYFMLLPCLVFIVLYMVLICCKGLRRRSPLNLILLSLLTVAMSLMMACFTTYYDTLTVIMALGTTVIVCLLVTLLSCQNKCDITGCGTLLCIFSMAFVIFSVAAIIIQLFFKYNPVLHLVISGVGTVLFCMYLLYDTQMIMGGKRIEISPEEYVLGAIQLYIDICYIFIYLLSIFGIVRGN